MSPISHIYPLLALARGEVMVTLASGVSTPIKCGQKNSTTKYLVNSNMAEKRRLAFAIGLLLALLAFLVSVLPTAAFAPIPFRSRSCVLGRTTSHGMMDVSQYEKEAKQLLSSGDDGSVATRIAVKLALKDAEKEMVLALAEKEKEKVLALAELKSENALSKANSSMSTLNAYRLRQISAVTQR